MDFTLILPPDYHNHSVYCGHATGTVEEMVQAALKKGFSEIGFAEHHPYPEHFSVDVPDCVVPGQKWPLFLNDVRSVQEKYGNRIEIRLGAEIDFLPGTVADYRQRLQEQSFDYVFGSVHVLEGVVVDYEPAYLDSHIESLGGETGVWQRYWDALESLIRSDLCDIVSHLDLPKKFGLGYPDSLDWDRVVSVLSCIKEMNKTLEINMGGIDRSVLREPYPGQAILEKAFEMGIDILIGSDAHKPDQVGRHFKHALQVLDSIGWSYLTVFSARQKSFLPLSRFL